MDSSVVAATQEMYESSSLDVHRTATTVLQRAQQLRLGGTRRATGQRATVTTDPTLPPLAWGCSIDGSEHTFTIGPGVEHGDGFVFEGVWDGDFTNGRVNRTEFAFGSGARMGKYVVFVPPKHCWEYLYVVADRTTGRSFVSNSAVFALVGAGIDPEHPFTRRVFADLRTSTDAATHVGIDRYDPIVAQDERYTFHRMMFYNFMVVDGVVQVVPTASTEYFKDFATYRAFLARVIDRVARNGADPARTTPLTPITPLSSGYDSTATAVLANELGYKDAVTQDLTIRGRFDSGQQTAATLGMNIEITHHLLGTDPIQAMGVTVEDEAQLDLYAEFLATAGLGDDVMLATMEQHLGQRIMLSGAMGDSAWKRRSTLPPGLPVRVVYGKSFTEFRLRVGYAFVPVPALGARLPHVLRRIATSPEMAPWTLGQPYDRPIARRIAEEAGLERGTFATGKAAANPTVRHPEHLTAAAVSRIAQRYVGAATSR